MYAAAKAGATASPARRGRQSGAFEKIFILR
jgi:hypothetical protein